jgi:hypothetical protein
LNDVTRIDELKHIGDTPANPIFNVVKYDKSVKPFGRSKEISCVIEKDTDCALSSICIIRKKKNQGMSLYAEKDHSDREGYEGEKLLGEERIEGMKLISYLRSRFRGWRRTRGV